MKNAISVLFIVCILLGTVQAQAKGKPAKPPGNDSATVQILSSGAVLAAVECEETMDANTTSVLCNKSESFVLDQVIVNGIRPGSGDDCFAAGEKAGAVLVFINKNGSAETWFRFHELDQAGDDILYRLEARATSWSGTFPPEEADLPIVMESNDWRMRATNRRQERDACLGSGTDSITISLDRCPTTGCP